MTGTDRAPKRVKAKIKRNVTEIAIVILDKSGFVEEIEEVHEEIDTEDIELKSIISVIHSY